MISYLTRDQAEKAAGMFGDFQHDLEHLLDNYFEKNHELRDFETAIKDIVNMLNGLDTVSVDSNETSKHFDQITALIRLKHKIEPEREREREREPKREPEREREREQVEFVNVKGEAMSATETFNSVIMQINRVNVQGHSIIEKLLSNTNPPFFQSFVRFFVGTAASISNNTEKGLTILSLIGHPGSTALSHLSDVGVGGSMTAHNPKGSTLNKIPLRVKQINQKPKPNTKNQTKQKTNPNKPLNPSRPPTAPFFPKKVVPAKKIAVILADKYMLPRAMETMFENTHCVRTLLFSDFIDNYSPNFYIKNALFMHYLLNTELDKLYSIPDLRFMDPVIKYANVNIKNQNSDAEVLRTTVNKIVNLYNKQKTYITSTYSEMYTIVPAYELFWHELIKGCLAGSLICCLEQHRKFFKPKILNGLLSLDNLIDKTWHQIKEKNVTCYNIGDWPSKCKMLGIKKTISRRIHTRDHIRYICTYHGVIYSRPSSIKKLVKIPHNVTLVIHGAVESSTYAHPTEQYDYCQDAWLNDLMNFDVDKQNKGGDIITRGSYYPNISMSKHVNEYDGDGIFVRCEGETQKQLDIGAKNYTCLENILKIASDDAENNNKDAIVFVLSCQNIHTDDHRDHLTTALAQGAYLRNQPEIVIGDKTYYTKDMIRPSAQRRKNEKPGSGFHRWIRMVNQTGGDTASSIACTSMLMCLTLFAAFVPR